MMQCSKYSIWGKGLRQRGQSRLYIMPQSNKFIFIDYFSVISQDGILLNWTGLCGLGQDNTQTYQLSYRD